MKIDKIVMVTALLATGIYALDIKVGVVGLVKNMPYKDLKEEMFLSPLFTLKYGDFYIQGPNLGYKLYQQEAFEIDAIFMPAMLGYESKDSTYLKGMEDRDLDLSSGLELRYKTGFNEFSLKMMYDFFNTHNGYTLSTEYGRNFLINENNVLTCYAGIEYFSDKKSDYYFGVKQREATENRRQYKVEETINQYIGIKTLYQIDQRWSLLGKVEYKNLDEKIYDSPIIEKHGYAIGYVGVLYAF